MATAMGVVDQLDQIGSSVDAASPSIGTRPADLIKLGSSKTAVVPLRV